MPFVSSAFLSCFPYLSFLPNLSSCVCIPEFLWKLKRFSITQSPCQQRREPFGTSYPFVHSETVALLIQLVLGNVGSLTSYSGVENYHSSISLKLHYLSSFSYIVRILPCSCLKEVRLDFLSFEMPITTWCDESESSDT